MSEAIHALPAESIAAVPETPPVVKETADDIRKAIFACDDIKYEPVSVPEWNRVIWVRTLSGEERDKFEASIIYEVPTRRGKKKGTVHKVNPQKLRAKLVIASACVAENDPTPLFKITDVDALAAKSGAAIDRVFDVCQRLSGISDDDMEELGNESSPEQSTHSG
jgi:hypothetical protein